MKNLFFTIASVFSLLVLSCNSSSDSSKKLDSDTSSKIISDKKAETFDSSAYKVKVRLFKHSGLDFDADGYCVNGGLAAKEKVTEIKSIEAGKIIKCSEGQYIQKLILEGNAEGLSLLFFDKNGKELHKKDNFKIENSISFSAVNRMSDGSGANKEKKEADFVEWFEKAEKFQLLYQGQVVNEISWTNNGWMRQQAQAFEEEAEQ